MQFTDSENEINGLREEFFSFIINTKLYYFNQWDWFNVF